MAIRKRGGKRRKSWDEMYAELVKYHETHGGEVNDIPIKSHLGSWMNRNRGDRRNYLTADQADKLNRLGVTWEKQADKNEKRWHMMYQLLLEFRRKYGHLNAKIHEKFKGENIGSWVGVQRSCYKKGQMKADRERLLDDVGFLWLIQDFRVWNDDRDMSKQDNRWNTVYKQLLLYREEHGDMFVPAAYRIVDEESGEQILLGRWVTHQRQMIKNGKMRADRRKLLDDIGFAPQVDTYGVSAHQQAWDRMFIKLLEYKRVHGHTRVPENGALDEDQKDLGRWVEYQRSKFNKNKLHHARRERLEALGFVWDGGKALYNRRMLLADIVSDEVGKAPASLDQQAFDDDDKWETMFHHLRDFKLKHGHTRVPSVTRTIDGLNLGWWALQQLVLYESGKLLLDRKERLMALRFRFIWHFSEDGWKKRYQRCKRKAKKTWG